MRNTRTLSLEPLKMRCVLTDLLALGLIYFVPALSHLLAFPVYLAEPMRLMLVAGLAHTTKKNAYLLALSLPLFSFLVSAHPDSVKMLLIMTELALNVWIFYFLLKRTKNGFAAMVSAIVISKIAYYSLKYWLISLALLHMNLVSTPLYIQVLTTLCFSTYLYFVLRKNTLKS